MDAWVIPLITGAVAIFSGYLGARWGGKHEHRQWHRNEKQKAYAAFPEETGIADYESVLNGVVITSTSIAKQRAAVHRLQLMAPENINEMANKAIESAKVLSRAIRDGVPTDGMEHEYVRSMTLVSYAMKLDLHSSDRVTRKAYKKFLSEMRNISKPAAR